MPQIISKNSSVPTELPKDASCKHNKCILLSILLLVIGLSLGFYFGGFLSSSGQSVQNPEVSAVKKGSYQDGYNTALDFARKKIQEKGMFFSGQMFGIPSATVKSVSGNSIVVEFDASLLDFFAEGKLTKTITVPDTVSIQQNIPKEFEEYQKEEVAYRKQMDDMIAKKQAGDTTEFENVALPMPYTIKTLKITDLKAGDVINVMTSVDISKSETFEATSITMAYTPEEMKEGIGNMIPGGTMPPLPVPPTEITPPVPEDPGADLPPASADSAAPDTDINPLKEETPPPSEKPADSSGVSVPAENANEPNL